MPSKYVEKRITVATRTLPSHSWRNGAGMRETAHDRIATAGTHRQHRWIDQHGTDCRSASFSPRCDGIAGRQILTFIRQPARRAITVGLRTRKIADLGDSIECTLVLSCSTSSNGINHHDYIELRFRCCQSALLLYFPLDSDL